MCLLGSPGKEIGGLKVSGILHRNSFIEFSLDDQFGDFLGQAPDFSVGVDLLHFIEELVVGLSHVVPLPVLPEQIRSIRHESVLLGYSSLDSHIYCSEYIYPKGRVKFSRKREDEPSGVRGKATL